MATWNSMDDVMDDLYTLSEVGVNRIREPSEHVRRARTKNKKSIQQKPGRFDSSSESEEEVARLPPLRGRPVKSNYANIAPGGVPSGLIDNHEMEIRKKLREVTGFGASNEYIEKVLKMKGPPVNEEQDEKERKTLESIRFIPTGIYKSSSSGSSRSSNKSVRNVNSVVNETKTVKKVVECPEKKEEKKRCLDLDPSAKPFHPNYFSDANEQNYDINSKDDFPTLYKNPTRF